MTFLTLVNEQFFIGSKSNYGTVVGKRVLKNDSVVVVEFDKNDFTVTPLVSFVQHGDNLVEL